MLRLTLMLCSHFKLQWDDPSSTASRLCNQLGCPFVRHMRVSVDMSLASVMPRFIHMTMWLRRCPRKTWRACWSSSSTRILQTAEATKQTQRLHFYSAVNGVCGEPTSFPSLHPPQCLSATPHILIKQSLSKSQSNIYSIKFTEGEKEKY